MSPGSQVAAPYSRVPGSPGEKLVIGSDYLTNSSLGVLLALCVCFLYLQPATCGQKVNGSGLPLPGRRRRAFYTWPYPVPTASGHPRPPSAQFCQFPGERMSTMPVFLVYVFEKSGVRECCVEAKAAKM